MIGRALLAVLLALASGGPATAQEDPAGLAARAAASLAEARQGLERAGGGRDRVAALTRTIRAYESGLEALREGIRRAAIREAAITARFDAESARLSRLLGAMLTIESSPGPLVLLHPSGPVGTARSGMILSDVTPAFQAEVDTLRAALEEVADLRRLQEGASDTLAEGLSGLQAARTELSQAIAERTDLPRRVVEDEARLRALAVAADTLESFAAGLTEIEGLAGDVAVDDVHAARGTLPMPVQGRVLRRFGDADAAGIRRPGLVMATRPLALVTTPWPATIRYRGPLLDYGNVIVLEPGRDVLIVLAGLGTVYGEVGQVLPAGAPVGLMGGSAPESRELLSHAAAGGGTELTETLYVEVREDDVPTDPFSWFAEDKEG